MSVSFVVRLVLIAAAAGAACVRNDVREDRTPESGSRPTFVRQVSLVPGGGAATGLPVNPFEGDTAAREEGRRMYGWFNCSGCHFEGGGGIGPPLMDRAWIYGGEPAQVFDSIASGRANGMPAFGDRINGDEIWKIALYVSSLAEQTEGGSESRGSVINGP